MIRLVNNAAAGGNGSVQTSSRLDKNQSARLDVERFHSAQIAVTTCDLITSNEFAYFFVVGRLAVEKGSRRKSSPTFPSKKRRTTRIPRASRCVDEVALAAHGAGRETPQSGSAPGDSEDDVAEEIVGCASTFAVVTSVPKDWQRMLQDVFSIASLTRSPRCALC